MKIGAQKGVPKWPKKGQKMVIFDPFLRFLPQKMTPFLAFFEYTF